MTSAGGLAGFWILALITLLAVTLGGTRESTLKEPDVPFPPARPITRNLVNICTQAQGRPRYPDSFFPPSYFSHFRRRGKAINRLESWYALCCSGQVAQQVSSMLCCVEQAWKQALSQFCVDEYSTKTLVYMCCEEKGDARWACFNRDVPNPNYSPKPGYTAPDMLPEPGFTFDPSACLLEETISEIQQTTEGQ